MDLRYATVVHLQRKNGTGMRLLYQAYCKTLEIP